MTYQEIYRGLKKEAGIEKTALMPIGKLNREFILPFLKSTAGMKKRLGVRFSQLPNIGYSISDNILRNKGFNKATEQALQKQFKTLTGILQHSSAKQRLKNLTGNTKYKPLQRLFDRADVDFRGIGRPMNGYGEVYRQLLGTAKLKRDLIRRSGIPKAQIDLLGLAAKKHIANLNQRSAAKALQQTSTDSLAAPSLWERLLQLFR